MTEPYNHSLTSELKAKSLIVGWESDTGKLGGSVISFLVSKLNCVKYSEIDPVEYFPMVGVSIEDDIVQFPECQFFSCPEHDLILFKSSPPSFEDYKFLNKILDIAGNEFNIKEIYAIGGSVSINPHTIPRQLMGTFSTNEFKDDLLPYDIDIGLNYETPDEQKPTLNSYLLWNARRRDIPGVNLWIHVPFYLMSVDDPKSQKRICEFFNQRFKLKIDLSEFDEAVRKQNRKINEVRNTYSYIDEAIMRLESNIRLSEEDNLKLVKKIEEYLKTPDE